MICEVTPGKKITPQAPASGGGKGAEAGFTLIELMVALALSAILSIMIMMVSTSAQETYTSTLQKVEVYNRFRLALSTLAADFSAWIPTQELEFYSDGKGGAGRRNFHFEMGEEVPDTRDEHGFGVVDGGIIDEYDEFAHIIQLHYQSKEKQQMLDGDTSTKTHDAYQVYFRAMTYIEGQNREANIEYMLADPSKPFKNGIPQPPDKVDMDKVRDLVLYKIVRFFRIDSKLITNINSYPVERRIVEVATNVTDFRVEYMSDNPFNRSRRKGSSKFRTPEEDYDDPIERYTRPRRQRGKNGFVYTKTFGYGSVKLGKKFPLAIAQTAVWGDANLRNAGKRPQPVRVGFTGNPDISFAEIVPGDRVYIFTEAERGGRKAGGNVAGRLAAFPSGDYTVKTNINGMLEFVEDIDSSLWGGKDQPGVRYKAAFMPASLRLTLRMVDDNGLNPKTMQQVVWLRRKSR
ncbi:MAG: prepilin-type N-terminal cleavage/methylation domain-containing protein [Planctomycetes bacterium]|nr:prepilin-type N-terminal cleavage/methylation domain-containing protein [Planctomycetota bacterium]